MALPILTVSRGQFTILRRPQTEAQHTLDIVLIPGIGTPSPDNWPFASEQWLSTLPPIVEGARILSFEYVSPFPRKEPSWEAFLMYGYDLLSQLSDLQIGDGLGSGTQTTPVILVCHSLGGVILKQALCVADKQFSRYGSLINAVAGIVFISTPHRYGDKASTSIRFKELLETTCGKTVKFPADAFDRGGAVLVDLADRFEGIAIRTPILSTYELRESKVNATTLRTRYQTLVPREACSVRASMESVVGLNLDHQNTCLFTNSTGGEGVLQFHDFLSDTMLQAERLVNNRLEEEEYQYATTSAYSPTLSELPAKVDLLEISEFPSNFASQGASHSRGSGFELIYPPTPEIDVCKKLSLPCYLLNTHDANADFCGREDVLALLASELLPSKTTVTTGATALRQFALCGFGGIGKTEIAREFARRHKSSFDAVFWVIADDTTKLDEHYQQMSVALGLEDVAECKSQVVSREIVKGWLSNPRRDLSQTDELTDAASAASDACWLLIFDNADDPMILTDYWPQGSGSILITSRDPYAKKAFSRKSSGLDLGPLSKSDSLKLFGHLTSIEDLDEEDSADPITVALGGIPLAISQMAGIVRRQDLTLAEFYELYTNQEEQADLYNTKFDSERVPYRHSLATVWAVDKLKPQARKLLELTAFLDPDVVGEDLMMELCVVPFSEGATFRKGMYIEARTDLLQSSLLQREKQRQQLSIHRIVQDVVGATIDADKRNSLFEHVVTTIWSNWPSAMPKPSKKPLLPQPKSSGGRLHVGRWPICAALYPHVLRLHHVRPTADGLSDDTNLLFAKLLSEAAWYQKERGQLRDFNGFFDTAQEICEASHHPDRDSVLADIHFCMGAIAMDSNEFDVSRHHKEESLELIHKICKEMDVQDDRLVLAYAELGISRTQDRRYAEAESDFKEMLRIRMALGNYIPRSGEANLAWTLLLQGKLEECDELLTASLAGREKALGKNDRESARTGLILGVFGNLRAAQGRWDESFEYHQRALVHMRATVGDRDFYTAIVYHKVAEHYARIDQVEEAISMANKALDIWSIDSDSNRNEIARTTFFKAGLFNVTGKPQKAAIALRVAARLRKEITSENRDAKTLTMKDFEAITAFWSC